MKTEDRIIPTVPPLNDEALESLKAEWLKLQTGPQSAPVQITDEQSDGYSPCDT